MKKLISFIITIFILFINCTTSYANKKISDSSEFSLELASLFKDHMILQRDMKIPVWGKGKPGDTIEVQFANTTKTTVVNAGGKWSLKLKPLKASFKSRSLLVTSLLSKKSIKVCDVLVGEVWICSGQSNMQMGIGSIPEIKALLPKAKNIRSFTVENTVAFEPQESCNGRWVNNYPNSAVALSFAYFLKEYENIPIGIILTCWGSSSIEAWMPREMIQTVPHFKTMMDEFDADDKTKTRIQTILDGPRPFPKVDNIFLRRQSNILYNAMMHPLIPYACRGLVWYQGERNTQSINGMVKTPWFSRNSGMLQYGETLKSWMQNYRKSWNTDDLNFLVVMLPGYGKVLETGRTKDANHPEAHSWAWMRESQLKALELSKTSVINTVDLGHIKNIHPKDKLPIGKRLATAVMKDVFKKDIVANGPVLKKVKNKGTTLVVSFKEAKGLKTIDDQSPTGFWICDASRKWVKANAIIKNEKVILGAAEITEPLYIRYAFTGKPEVNLVNGENSPAFPFRTDDFKPLNK